MQRKLDIFISYRRADGAQYARILQLKLIERGYRVFLDYDELTDGIFGENIRKAIEDAPIFISILSPHYLDRCTNEHDWVRNELKLALQKKKFFIFVNPDKSFKGIPDGTPEDIANTISCIQHSEISFGQALDATIDLLVMHRIEPVLGKSKERTTWPSSEKSDRTISDVFISYSRDDKLQVHPFAEYISKAISKNCWIDLKGIESGDEFEDVIMRAIDECQVVLFMLSDSSLKSKWTKREVLYAEGEGKRIVPVLVDGDKLRGWFKFHFGNVDFIDIQSEEQKEKLIGNLKTWLGSDEEEKKPKTEEETKQKAENRIKCEIEQETKCIEEKAKPKELIQEVEENVPLNVVEEETLRKAEERATPNTVSESIPKSTDDFMSYDGKESYMWRWGAVIVIIIVVLIFIFKPFSCSSNQTKHNDMDNGRAKGLKDTELIQENNSINDSLSSYKSTMIGDYFYSDGSTSKVFNTDKECIGVVFSLSTTEEENKKGWTHGHIVALEDVDDGKKYRWGPIRDLPSPHTNIEYDQRMVEDKDGYIYTYKGETEGFPAFEAVKKFPVKLPNNTSGWYLPSVGQWYDILKNIGKMDRFTHHVNFDATQILKNLKKANILGGVYLTSTEAGASEAWIIDFDENPTGFYAPYPCKSWKYKLRAVAAF